MSRVWPLMARPYSSSSSSSNGIGFSLHNPKLTPWNQPLSDYGGGKREMMMMNRGALVSSRWNPTPEQVQALEEMYQRGTRTPSAQQIQQIASKLRRFGKIEGKNVFYWFQNHKARDRQKKRRQLQLHLDLDLDLLPPNKDHISPSTNKKRHSAGLSRKDVEIEHPKKLPTMSKCNTSSKYLGGEVDECKRDGWTQLELQQQISVTTETGCRPLMDLSSNVYMHKIRGQENARPFVLNLCKMKDDFEENRTLELFPVTSSGLGTLCSTKEEMDIDVSRLGTKLVPNQFFEFLPTKKKLMAE